MNRTDIIEAYLTIRKENQSIPDDVLDFMKDAAIEKIGFVGIKMPLIPSLENGSPSYPLPKMIAPYCQVGTLVSLNTSFLGQDIGTTCIVYEVTSEAQDVECVGIISQSGVNLGYFASEEIEHHLEFIKHTQLKYTFISAMRLQEDFRQGRFEQYFK